MSFRLLRDLTLLALGCFVAIYELVGTPPPFDANAGIFAAACLGIAAGLRQDEKRKGGS